jgi:hypothetical protein
LIGKGLLAHRTLNGSASVLLVIAVLVMLPPAAGCASDEALDAYKSEISGMLQEAFSAADTTYATLYEAIDGTPAKGDEYAAQVRLAADELGQLATVFSGLRTDLEGIDAPEQGAGFHDRFAQCLESAESYSLRLHDGEEYLATFGSAYADLVTAEAQTAGELEAILGASSLDAAALLATVESWATAWHSYQARISGLQPLEGLEDVQGTLVTHLDPAVQTIDQMVQIVKEMVASGSSELPTEWTVLGSEAAELTTTVGEDIDNVFAAGRALAIQLTDDSTGLDQQQSELEDAFDQL